MRSTLLKRNMDIMLDRSMLEYDRIMQEKHENGEAKRYIESRRKRRELEEKDKSIRLQQEKIMVSIVNHHLIIVSYRLTSSKRRSKTLGNTMLNRYSYGT
jgi:hypothetical protein